MIIRKPYAFLIKNFKKIHLGLLLLAVYVYYKTAQTYSFVREFIELNAYDSYNEPISRYITTFSILFIIILIIGSLLLALLLKHKEKPWKIYLIPIVQYSVLLVAFYIISSFFNAYTGAELTSVIRAWRDVLFICQIIQFGIFLIYIIRIFGIDLNKFNFKLDEEYLELEQKDKEELEININIDKDAIKRTYKKLLRNLNYIYQEHKKLSRMIIIIFILAIGIYGYNYISTHHSYSEGDSFQSNGYTIQINNSYYSDKAYNGEVISDKSSFVIVDVTITNNNRERNVNLDRFHIMNGISNYSPTAKTYETEFQDLGKAYDTLNLKTNQSKNILLIYKVAKELKTNRFVLYYQELTSNSSNYKKIKLNIKDYSKIEEQAQLTLGSAMKMNIQGIEENIILENYIIQQNVEYTNRLCTTTNCSTSTQMYTAPNGYKVMRISFGSTNFEGQDMGDFIEDYGKIIYKDSENKDIMIPVKNAIDKVYFGKYIYVLLPDAAANSSSISFEFIIRNNKYIYKIK